MSEPLNKLDWEQIERVMGRALELPEPQRAAYLDQQPPSIRAEVESLLAAYRRSNDFLGNETDAQDLAPRAGDTPNLSLGTHLGPYRIGAVIGQGGMGVVYRAIDTKLNRPVAIKFLFDDVANPAARRRFQREAQTVSSLNHPHILTVHDVGDFEGRQYLVTEFVDGGTLKDWVRSERPGWRQIIELLAGVADGLATAHSAGILHRDIKPENILVGRNGYAKLVDFGLAKLEERSTPNADTRALTEGTRPGIILGTIAYMSPEQASGKTTDARSDIFSFGVVLHELLEGRRPFEGATELEQLQTIIHGAPRPISVEIPLPLRMVVEKALEKDPAERYQSTRDLVVDLRRLIRQSGEAAAPETSQTMPEKPARMTTARKTAVFAALILSVISLVVVKAFLDRQPEAPREQSYTQITNFTDSVVSPALSPDGRMVAFIRGDSWWLSQGEIYVKLLPNGEPVQITRDSRFKYGLSFSPDGSRIAYTGSPGWNSYTVSPLGGEPRLLLANAAGLTWLDERRLLFSEIRTGVHMGLVTALENRSEHRPIYFPEDVRQMVHLAYASSDRKWALVVEMNPVWQPCRVVPLDGSSAGWQVGPKGSCTSAAWSPNGKWMYLGVEMAGNHHLWRQRFPRGEPEQITSGPMEAEGVAVAPDGKSLVTSIGMRQSAVWLRDGQRDRAISSEGYVPTVVQSGLFGARPTFSRDGSTLFYLRRASPEAAIELWKTDLKSGRSENVAPGISMLEYDVSDDGKEVVFSTRPQGRNFQVWIAVLDRSSPPKLISSSGETSPHFGPSGEILFRLSEDNTHYLARMTRNGSERVRLASYPIGNVQSISPDRRWVVAISPLEQRGGAVMAVPIDGAPARRLCASDCRVTWAPNGKFLYVALHRAGKTLAIPIPAGEMFPNIAAAGIRGPEDAAVFPGTQVLDGWEISPGPDPSTFAYVKTTVHRNLFRIPLRDE